MDDLKKKFAPDAALSRALPGWVTRPEGLFRKDPEFTKSVFVPNPKPVQKRKRRPVDWALNHVPDSAPCPNVDSITLDVEGTTVCSGDNIDGSFTLPQITAGFGFWEFVSDSGYYYDVYCQPDNGSFSVYISLGPVEPNGTLVFYGFAFGPKPIVVGNQGVDCSGPPIFGYGGTATISW